VFICVRECVPEHFGFLRLRLILLSVYYRMMTGLLTSVKKQLKD